MIATLLDKDTATLATWATDLGLLDLSSFEQDLATFRSQVDALIAGLKPNSPVLNSTIQSIEEAFFKKGSLHSTGEANFYEAFVKWFQNAFTRPPKFSKLVQKIIDFDLALIRQYGGAKKIKAAKESTGSKYYEKSGVQRSLNRMQAVLAVWCKDQSADKTAELATTLNSLLAGFPLPIDLGKTMASKGPVNAKSVSSMSLEQSNYVAWAKDLGFDASEFEGQQIATLIEAINEWVEELWSYNQTLWKQLVPESGPAPTLQGELVRALGRLESEYFRNGMMNWGDGSGYYEGFVERIHATLKDEKSFTTLVKKGLDDDIDVIKFDGAKARASASGNAVTYGLLSNSTFGDQDVEKSHQRIGLLITIWCRKNPGLIALNVK